MASVTLKTGAMGTGKTLSAVSELAALLAGWERNPDERRPVYVHGIKGLVCDHAELPVYPLRGKPGDAVQRDKRGQPVDDCAVDWSQVPDGAHVIIDEAQKLFPARPNNAPVPAHVRWFELARQNGCTVVLITQAPTSVDVEVRKRCGLHQHYEEKLFGAVSVMEWVGAVSTSLKNPTTARPYRKDKKAFALYESAAMHTKATSKPKTPWWFPLLVAGVVGAAVGIPWAAWKVWSMLHKPSAPDPVASSPSAVVSAPSAPGAGASAPGPGGSGVGPSSPAASGVAPGLPASAPGSRIAGCMANRLRCQCIDDAGWVLSMPEASCRSAAREYGRQIPYPVRSERGELVAVASSAGEGGHGMPDASRVALASVARAVPGVGSEPVAPAAPGRGGR